MAVDPWADSIEKMMADYQSGAYEGRGIPSRLYQYAQQNPNQGIDRSGGNLAQTDAMFNFYNPNAGQQAGLDWFSTDDRNLPANYGQQGTGLMQAAAGSTQGGGGFMPSGQPEFGQIATTPQGTGLPQQPGGSQQGPSMPTGFPNSPQAGMPTVQQGQLNTSQGGQQSGTSILQMGGGDPGFTIQPGYQTPDQFQGAINGLSRQNPNQGQALLPAGTPTSQVTPGMTPPPVTQVLPSGGGGAAGGAGAGGVLAPGAPAGPQAPSGQGLDPNVPTGDLYNQILQRIMESMNVEGRGLSPAAKAAMTTRAMEQVPAEFERLKRNLATQQLREGGALPKGGGYFRQSGQLGAAELATKFGLLRDVDLADAAEMSRTREADRAFRLQALGLAGQLTGQRGQFELDKERLDLSGKELGQRWDIANLDADTRLKLGQMGIDSQEKLSNMESTLRRDLAQMGIDSAEKLAAADTNLRRDLTQMGIDSNLVLGKLDAQTRIDLMKMQVAGDSSSLRMIASLGSSALANPALMGEVIKGVKGLFGGDGAGGVVGGAGGAVGGLGTSKFGSSILKFAKDPVTMGIAAALAVGATWLKSQAHWEANTMVKEFENPFANDFVIPFHDNFFKAAESGKMTKEDAGLAIRELEAAWADYKTKARDWSKGSSDKDLVANQSISGRNKSQGWTGQANPGTLADTIARTLANMRQVEGALT